MPGTLHVTVLEAAGLPAGNTAGSSNYFVSVKVSLGEQEFVTRPKRPHGGKIASWNSEFEFPVLNLTDWLHVTVCDATGVAVSSVGIEVPTIVQEWFREEHVSFDEGGRIHLRLNFILTKEEQTRLEFKRAAADTKEFRKRRDDMLRLYDFKRKEDLCVNNGLRTIAENARVHAGQPLDNWEVFSRKKGKEDLPHGDIISRGGLEYLQVLPTAKELLMNTDEEAPNVKDIPMQLPSFREQTLAPKALADTKIPRLREGNIEPRLQQKTYTPGPTYQAQGTSRLTNAWVRVDTNANLTSEDFSSKENFGQKLLAPQTAASVDGWVCVERAPMTWEDASKVAQKARETVFRADSTSSPLTSLPNRGSAASPVTSWTSGKMNNSSQIHPGQGATYSPLPLPLPLPPKQSPSRITSGCVKARINAFESSVKQDSDLSMSKLENENIQAENSPAKTAVAARDQTIMREKLKKWEDRGRNQELASRNSAVREECAKANHDRGKASSREDSSTGSIANDQEARVPECCQSSILDKRASGGRLDSKDTAGNLTSGREFGDTRMAWRLPELPENINVEARDIQLKQSWTTEKDSVRAAEKNLSRVHKKECGIVLDQANCVPISQDIAALEELGDRVEERGVPTVGTSLAVEEKTIKPLDVASQDRKVKSKACLESQHLNKVRRPRSSMTSPKPARSDLQNRSGDSLQAWKHLQDSLHPSRKAFLIPANLNEKFEQKNAYGDRVTSKDDQFATAAPQVDIFFKDQSSIELENKNSPPVRKVGIEDSFHRRGRGLSSANDSKILGHLGSGLKQVLSGAVILAGLFALWPKNGRPFARYHVVKAGETLSSIAPGQCTDPSSNFCRINPRVCDQKTIYPGQRIRLS